jgi:serine-type D-Ala-D-Ala carboxypeptidase (penicillin-binding protein 5/6)
MRLFPRLILIAGLAVTTGIAAAGCSGTPRSADASRATKPSSRAITAHVPRPQVAKVPAPTIQVLGAPQGVQAQAGILMDADTGQVLWERDPDTERPIASITKVMTAYLVIQAGNLNREIKVPAGVTAYVEKYGASSDGLIPGQTLTAHELLYGLLLESGADAAYTLATAYGPGMSAFVARMNATARALGMMHTHFASPDGLPYPTEFSTYSTPSDLMILGQTAMKSAVFRSIVDQSSYSLPKGHGHGAYEWSNTDELIGSYPGIIGIKDGFTNDAGHCLLFEAVRDGRPLIGDVLDSPLTGPDAAAQDAAQVLNWGFTLKSSTSQH